MKYNNLLSILVLFALVTFSSCGNDEPPKNQEIELVTPTQSAPPIWPSSKETKKGAAPEEEEPEQAPAQNALGVWHFTCEKGCDGGSGDVGTCAKCGGALTHNQAYHAF